MVNHNAARHLLFIASVLLCLFGYIGYKLNQGKNPRYDAPPANQFASHQTVAPPAPAAPSPAVLPLAAAKVTTRPTAPPPAALKTPPPPQGDDDLDEWIPSARGDDLALAPAPGKALAPPTSPYRPPQDSFAATPHSGVITGLIPAPPSAGTSGRPEGASVPPAGLPMPLQDFAGGSGMPGGSQAAPASPYAASSLPPAVISGLKPPGSGGNVYPSGPVSGTSALPSGQPYNYSDASSGENGDLAFAGSSPSPYGSGVPPGMGAGASQSVYPGTAGLPPPQAAGNGSAGNLPPAALPGNIGSPPPAALPPRAVPPPPSGSASPLPIPGGTGIPSESAMRPGGQNLPRPPASPASPVGSVAPGGAPPSSVRAQTAPPTYPSSPVAAVPPANGIAPAAGARGQPPLPPPAARQDYEEYGYDDTDDAAVLGGSESLRVFVVLPGDTLSSIASRELGSISLADNIFLLNRDVIADPDHLLAGVKIRLPVRENAPVQLLSSPGRASLPTPAAPAAAQSGPRKHVVARGETLSSIALLYYGTGTGWRFLYENNKKAVPNANQLAVGVELTIPPIEEMKR